MVREILCGLMVIAVVFAGTGIYGQPVVQADAKAEELLKQFSKNLAGSSSFRFTVRASTLQKEEQLIQEKKDVYEIAMQRPNMVSMVHKQGLFGPTVVSNGTELVTFLPTSNQYQSESAPADFVAIFEQGQAGMLLSQTVPLVDAFLAVDPYAGIVKDVRTITYEGMDEREGSSCHLIKFVQEDMDWKLWLEEKSPVVMRRIEADISRQILQAMPDKADSLRYEFAWDFSGWEFDGKETEKYFQFTPPAGAKKVKEFTNPSGEQKHRMVGETAPNFKLTNLENQEVELASHLGKDVVILDFWSIRCGPCRTTLPILAEVTQGYKDKSVVFYAINTEDQAGSIKDFLRAQNLSLNVLLERNGEVSRLYGLEYLPQTVLIDKKGIIQNIHIGALPNLKEVLTEEIEALREGRNLVARADLAATELVFSPAELSAGQPIAFTCTIQNKGTEDFAGPYHVVLLVNNKQVFGGMKDVKLAPAEKTSFSPAPGEWNLQVAAEGSFPYKLLVIAGNDFVEQNPKDNMLEGILKVNPAKAEKP